jgi:hypothetical protein
METNVELIFTLMILEMEYPMGTAWRNETHTHARDEQLKHNSGIKGNEITSLHPSQNMPKFLEFHPRSSRQTLPDATDHHK